MAIDIASWLDLHGNVVQVVLTAVNTTLTLVVAVATFLSVREIRKTRQAQYRPVIVAEIECDGERHTYHLVVRNSGASVARDIAITMEPRIRNPANPQLTDQRAFEWLDQGVPTLAPGRQLRMILGAWGNFDQADVPRRFILKATYADELRHRWFDEAFHLDVDAIPLRPSNPFTIHSVVVELHKLNDILSKR